MGIHKFGPGTISVTVGSELAFECQVRSVNITHEYSEVAERVDYLGDGCSDPAIEERADGVSLTVDHDLSASALYAFCLGNDLQVGQFAYTPNSNQGTVTPASWAADVVVKVPNVEAGERGARLTGSVDWPMVAGSLVFTPGADA